MQIFPKNNHFRFTMRLNFILGVWPFVFAKNPTLRAMYDVYSKFTLTIFAIFVVTTYIEVAVLGGAGTAASQEITGNLCITLLGSMILLRVIVVRKPRMTNLIMEFMDQEDVIYERYDEETVGIYNLYVTRTRRTSLIYIANGFLVIISFFIFPLLTAKQVYDEGRNRTITVRDLPEPAWVPWDTQEYYWWTYAWLVFSGGIAAFNVAFLDTFMFSLIIFPLGQIDILMHQLRNLKKYALEARTKLGCSLEHASFLVMRQCIIKHKDIIRYIDDYNLELRYIMVFEFLVSSIQLASITVQLVMSHLDFFDLVHWGGFALCMLMRLLVYYWYANEIMLQSSSLGNAIWESDWFEEPYRVKQLMLIMIKRSQKPLGLEIGPFTTMTLQSFLGIVKATYSYVSIMYR